MSYFTLKADFFERGSACTRTHTHTCIHTALHPLVLHRASRSCPKVQRPKEELLVPPVLVVLERKRVGYRHGPAEHTACRVPRCAACPLIPGLGQISGCCCSPCSAETELAGQTHGCFSLCAAILMCHGSPAQEPLCQPLGLHTELSAWARGRCLWEMEFLLALNKL